MLGRYRWRGAPSRMQNLRAQMPPSLSRTVFALFIAAANACAIASCAGDDAQFNVKYAPGYAKGGTVSVFGIFKDGRMSPESWDQLGTRLLKDRKCETAYSVDLVAQNQAVSSAIDDYARQNGITDDLLDQLAPVAKGDAILVITIAGRPPQIVHGDGGVRPPPQPMRGAGRGRSRTTAGYAAPSTSDGNVFEVSASLFSIRLHRSVALVAMTYSGRDVDMALARFADKLAAEMPSSACAGWNWDVKVDIDKIHKLDEE